jgi:hypothetical protein
LFWRADEVGSRQGTFSAIAGGDAARVGVEGAGRRRPGSSVVRSARVKARLTEAEFALAAATASRSGLSPGAWISELVVRAVSASDTAAASRMRDILAELVRVRTQLERTHVGEPDGPSAEGDALVSAKSAVLDAMQQVDAVTSAVLAVLVRSRGSRRL